MSQVFEALKRAGEEKEEREVPQWQSDEKVVREEPDRLLKVPSSPKPIAFPQARSIRRSWRERVEEFFFGWDLKRYKTHPLVALERESAVAEQYKILREHVKMLLTQTGARSIAITSPVKGDGKTSVTANLATAIALDTEQRVLLIDADLRSPELHRYFGIPARPGLADFLRSNSKEDLSDYIQTGLLPNLQIIPAGKPEALSSELLASSRTREFMEAVYSTFPGYRIIVDAPPILATSDPLVLANAVELIIMVVRANKTPKKYLLEAIETLNSDKLKGIVLSGTDSGLASRYYRYYQPSKD